MRVERREHGRGVLRPGAVVEGQHDLAFAQEVVALEMLEAEARTAGGVDLHGPCDAQRIRVAGHETGLAAGGGGAGAGAGVGAVRGGACATTIGAAGGAAMGAAAAIGAAGAARSARLQPVPVRQPERWRARRSAWGRRCNRLSQVSDDHDGASWRWGRSGKCRDRRRRRNRGLLCKNSADNRHTDENSRAHKQPPPDAWPSLQPVSYPTQPTTRHETKSLD